MPSAGKCNWCTAREITRPMPSDEKDAYVKPLFVCVLPLNGRHIFACFDLLKRTTNKGAQKRVQRFDFFYLMMKILTSL